jgi:peptidoglycan/xylan/chitin deacetylase (PgdA/CDA1 family)
MKLTKTFARKVVFPAVMAVGGDRLLLAAGKNRCINVMYHGVVQEDSTYFSPRHIEVGQFERQLYYLKRNFRIISLSAAFDHLQNGKPFKEKTITVSFDDGFQNNLTHALPLLEKYAIPTTFFVSSVCTEPMTTRWLWSEVIAALKYFYPSAVIQLGDHRFVRYADTKTGLSITQFLKTCPYNLRDEYITHLMNEYALEAQIKTISEEVWKLMNRDELIQLSRSSVVEIGSHGRLHYNLGDISSDKAWDELITSKRALEETIGKPVQTIAYPDGSYTEEVKNLAEKAGYTGQLAVDFRTLSDSTDKRIMARHGISSTTTFESNMLFLNKAFLKG